MSRPIVLLHGYSDKGAGLAAWRDRLSQAGHDVATIHLSEYVSLSNEVTIRDVAEGFERALAIHPALRDGGEFDAIVHSTGMLVIREWLSAYARRPDRKRRLKHLIGLAPATFGSPMAHKGRSWLGAIFKGSKELGPDFMEAGDLILMGLELGSTYTWELAEKDLITEEPVYGPTGDTPFPFIFIGLDGYSGLKGLATEEGTDGTVRWSGAGFNCRKIALDLRWDAPEDERVTVQPWAAAVMPPVFLDGLNHSSILRKPSDELVALVVRALAVETGDEYEDWWEDARRVTGVAVAADRPGRWQQFQLRARDERGDPIRDYYVELGRMDDEGEFRPFDEGGFLPVVLGRRKILDVHTFTEDPSMRNVHVDLDALAAQPNEGLHLRIIASSGTKLVSYLGGGSQDGKWDALVDLHDGLKGTEVDFFRPYTTTLVEIMLNREPMPLVGQNDVFWFLPRAD